MYKLLIIEDEPAILLGLKDELSKDFIVFEATNGKTGLELALRQEPHLILLDIILPDIDGFKICQQIKEKGVDSSIIILTARNQIVDKVKGLELGADDYITKPFSLEELKARIKAVLRRKEASWVESYKDKLLEIDFKRYKAFKKNKPIKLSLLEFKLLRFLVSHKGKVVSRKELLEQVWGYHTLPSTRTVDTHILSLRKKLGKNYIFTIHGLGYRFEPLPSNDLGDL
ncbi:MAG: response regulator transcription factor [Candidatus Omnitrophica bacterium]|nr:response regulator transcription factor [Candidatus Omnitrophota bacterium]